MVASSNEITHSGNRDADVHVCDPPHACVDCLSKSGLSAELIKDQVDALFEVVDIRRLSKGEVLISEGQYDDHLYAIARGEFEVICGEKDDREVQPIRLGPGTFTGELGFLNRLEPTATVRAAEDGSCVIALRRADLEPMLSDDRYLVYRVKRAALRSARRALDAIP